MQENLQDSNSHVICYSENRLGSHTCTHRGPICHASLRQLPTGLEYQCQEIGHVRYINIQAWLRGFRVKIANFSRFFCLSIPKRDLDTKKTTPNIEV